MPLDILVDWAYWFFVQNMDGKQREEFDAQLDAIRYAELYAARDRARRRKLARLNAQVAER